MKYIYIISLILLSLNALSQTRDADYNYIINHYISGEENPAYSLKEITNSITPKTSEINASLQFVNFKTIIDGKNRGIAIIYKEKKRSNEITKMLVICFPEENSTKPIMNKTFDQLNSITDNFVLKYILTGLITIGVNPK